MDNTFFIYQKAITDFVRNHSDKFISDVSFDWESYVLMFEKKENAKFSYFRAPWRFEDSLLNDLKDKIVYLAQVTVNESPSIICLIQYSNRLHLRGVVAWDEHEHKFHLVFEFVFVDMKDVLDFYDSNINSVLNKEVRTHMGLHR